MKMEHNFQSLDVVQVKKMAKKAKTPCRSTKFLLHKKFKFILEKNVMEQTYLKIPFRFSEMYF